MSGEAFEKVREGASCRREWRVTEEMAASHLARLGVKVLSTPSMVLMVEATLRECLDQMLPEGFTTVGTGLFVRHKAPVPVGEEVSVEGVILTVDGARVTAYAKVVYKGQVVGEVLNERRIVKLEDYIKRVSRT